MCSQIANRIYKITLFITHNILTNDKHSHGYLLLQLLRSYLIIDTVDTYASLEVHMTETLAKGEEALRHYSAIMQVW